MNFFVDVEFTNQTRHADIVSIAVVNENGNHFYAECTDFDSNKISAWSHDNVFPNLKYVTNRDLENLLQQYNRGSLGLGIDYPNQFTSQYAHDNMNTYDNVVKRLHQQYGVEPPKDNNDPTGEIQNRMNRHQLADEHGLRSPNPQKQAELQRKFMRDCGCFGTQNQVSDVLHQWLSQFLGENSGKLYFFADQSMMDGLALHEILNARSDNAPDVRKYTHPHVFDIASIMKERGHHPEANRTKLAFGKQINESNDLKGLVPESIRTFLTFRPNNALYDAFMEHKLYESVYKKV